MMLTPKGAIACALAIAGFLLACPPARAMEEFNAIVTIDELCALIACRPASEIMMRRDDGEGDIAIKTKKSPHVFQGVVTVLSGEANRYDIDVREGAIRDIRLSRYPGDAAALFSLELGQPAALAGGASELRVMNPLPLPLTLLIEAVRPGKTEPEPPLVCAVAAGSLFPLRFDYPVYQVVVDLDLAAERALTGQCRAI